MKKVFLLLATWACMQVAVADDTAATIKIKINGAAHDNRYFLCLPDIGCLSILAAQKGKVYPILYPFEMNTLFVMDASNHFRVTSQGLPDSCNVTVEPNHTITILGNIAVKHNNTVMINQLHCSVS